MHEQEHQGEENNTHHHVPENHPSAHYPKVEDQPELQPEALVQTETQGGMSFINTFTPIQTFVFGLAAGIMTLCTVGFFVLLGLMLNGGGLSVVTNDSNTIVDEKEPSAVVDQVQPSALKDIKVDPPIDDKRDHIRGNKNAKVTFLEYSDFECSFCSRFHPTVKEVLDSYGDSVRWVYRQFPLESIHQNARKMANATECAGEQGKFWEYTDVVFERQSEARSEDVLKEIAKTLGLNTAKFDKCLADNKFDADVQSDIRSAAAAGCTGTPCSIIIGKDGSLTPMSGALPLERIKAIIDPLLK